MEEILFIIPIVIAVISEILPRVKSTKANSVLELINVGLKAAGKSLKQKKK